MKDIVSVKDVRIAWREFNDLPKPQIGSPARYYEARETAWLAYTKIRDRYLYQIGTLRLPQTDVVWHYGDGLKKH